jgi:hypothetical protein
MNTVVFTLCNPDKSYPLHCSIDGYCDALMVPSVQNCFEQLFHVSNLWNLLAGVLTSGLVFLYGIGYLEDAASHDYMIQSFFLSNSLDEFFVMLFVRNIDNKKCTRANKN